MNERQPVPGVYGPDPYAHERECFKPGDRVKHGNAEATVVANYGWGVCVWSWNANGIQTIRV